MSDEQIMNNPADSEENLLGRLNQIGVQHFDELVRMRYRSLVFDDDQFARVVFVCAETGMGKTRLSQDLLYELSGRGMFVNYVSLRNFDSKKAASKLSRIARDLRGATVNPKARKAMIIDDVPPIEECDLLRAKNALERMVSRNAFVLINLLPEAEVLAEELPDCTCVRSSDLTFVFQREERYVLGPHSGATGGIAALVYGFETVGISGSEAQAETRLESYARSLSELAQVHIRPTLTLEERRLRLLMLLLGHGSFEELLLLDERAEEESVELLQRDAPLFGIDSMHGTFCCIGLDEPEVFFACADGLRELCASMPETTALAVRALAGRDEFLRAAQVLELCDRQYFAELGSLWGVELVCVGKASIVRRALEIRGQTDCTKGEDYLLAERALAVMDLPRADFDDRPIPEDIVGGSPLTRRRRGLLTLLRACRDLDMGVTLGRLPDISDDGLLAQVLFDHVRARSLLLAGKLSEAYVMLLNNPSRLTPDMLCKALLCDDFEITQLLTGESPHVNEQRAYVQARKTIEESGIQRLACYRRVLESMLLVMAGREESLDGAEEAMSRAERMGDTAVRSVMLLASAVMDNRNGAYPRAHVRAMQAMRGLGGKDDSNLILVARFLDALSSLGLGDDGPLTALSLMSEGSIVRDLCTFAMCPGNGEEMRIELTTLSRTSCSRDAAWMLNVLCNDFDERSRLFRQCIPSSWSALSRRSVRKMRGVSRLMERGGIAILPPNGSVPGVGSTSLVRSKEEAPRRIQVNLLGEFEVYVDGRKVNEAAFGRKRARAFLILVASSKNHSVNRHTIIESIWPETDYDSGRQRIYEVSSVIRNCLKSGGKQIDPFVKTRGAAMVSLNSSLVDCDVEQFERAAHSALSEKLDERAVELAVKATSLYHGDLCDTPYDARGVIEARRRELRTLFVDVSITGARAASRLDMLPLAVRMAWSAHEASVLREDVALVLIEALKASGRAMDAREVYRDYARSLLEASGIPPSASLRAAVSGLFPAARSGLSNKTGRSREDHTLSC